MTGGVRVETFWGHVERRGESDCWPWVGRINDRGGYGKYSEGKAAHRIAYELEVGPIPSGLEIDHLCNAPNCVNPKHMEPVTHAENMRRRAERRTHCKWGHEYTTGNTRVWRGARLCRACSRRRSRQRTKKGN